MIQDMVYLLTYRYRDQSRGDQWGEEGGATQGQGSGRYKILSVGQAQGCIVQHREYSQYFVITVNILKYPLKSHKNVF